MTTTLTQEDLRQFSGTEQWYKHGLVPSVLYTDGARHVAEAGGAYWLLDEIALAQKFDKRVAAESFQVWTLTVRADCSATLACEDGSSNPVLQKSLDFTDFPLPKVTLWLTDNVILLPSEY